VDVPDDLRYSDDHEWLRPDGEQGLVGITRYAADELGDVVFVELPAVGRTLSRGETVGVIDSV
jgi:glycine cleavage system H protein